MFTELNISPVKRLCLLTQFHLDEKSAFRWKWLSPATDQKKAMLENRSWLHASPEPKAGTLEAPYFLLPLFAASQNR